MHRSLIISAILLLLNVVASAQTGTGLTAKYYDTETFGTLKTTRVDPGIDFNWGTGIPAGTALTSADSFSVAWSGQLAPAYSELYTFYLAVDDYARLWVDDQLLVGRTFYQGGSAMRAQIRLKAEQRVNIRVEYAEKSGSAFAKLEWESNSQPRQVIPAARLYPATEIPNGGALMREVWKVDSGTGIASLLGTTNYPQKPLSRDVLTSFECIARDWEDGFGTRVTGYLRPPVSGAYTFAVSGDEAVELYLSTDANSTNKSKIASVTQATGFRQWDASAGQQSVTLQLQGGRPYYVELLHKEESGADHWSVAWMPPGASDFSVIPGTALMMPGVDAVAPATTGLFDTLATGHPRLGISRERLLWLKQMYQSSGLSAAKTRALSVISSANSDMASAPTTGRSAQDRLQRLALAWWLTDDSRYAESAWTNIQHCIDNADWANGDWKPWKGLENGVIATGFDWLYPYWSTARKTAMIDCMVNKGFAGGWTDRYDNNIGVILNSGHLMAAVAVGLENETVAESSLALAIQRLRPKIDRWAANAGAWFEGTGYGIFTKWNLGQAMPAMETALGSTFDLGRSIGLHTAAKEPLTIASNTRQRFTFSDIGTASHGPVGWANWWGRRYNAPEVYDYSRQIGNSPLSALFLPETTVSPAAAGMNPDTAYRGPVDSPTSSSANFQEVVTLRENWTDAKATFVGGLGGTYMAHGMLQSGSFQLYARGLSWFVDLSSETYNQPGWTTSKPNPNGPDRWDYYRNRAEGHNTVVINPTANPDRIYNAASAPLINYQSAPNGQRSLAVWDLSKNITGVTRVQRGIQLLNNRKQVLVQDEIVTPSASKVWWFAHYTYANNAVTISPDGSTVTLQQGSERLWGKIIGGGTWSIRPATPLPTSPNPAENTDNSAYRKLAIELTGVTNTTIAVWFVPLAPGENPPETMPTVAALSTWNLTSSNEGPVARHASVDSDGDAPVDVALPTYLTDDWTPAGQMSYMVNGALGGDVVLLPDGVTARFTPTPGFIGLRSFTFVATDLDGAPSNPATVVFSVAPQIATWIQPGSGGWSTSSNWQGSLGPASSPGGDIRFFSGQSLASATYTVTNDLPAPFQLNRLTLAGTGTATSVVNLEGNPLTFVGNGIVQPVIDLPGSTSGFRYQVALPLVLEKSVTLNSTGSGTFLFSGPISGSGGVTRTGTAGTLIFSADNNYAGPTFITAGTFQIGNDGATGTLGNGEVTIASGAALRIDRTGSAVISNDITGAGRVIVNGTTSADVVSLTGDNDFTGEVRVDNGSLRVTDARQIGTGTKNIIAASSTALLRIDGSGAPVIFPAEFSFQTSNPNGAILNEAGDNEILGNLTISSGAGGTRLTVAKGSLTIGGTVTSNFTGRSLDLRGVGNGIINGNFIDGAGANTISGFSKNDAGTWTLNGNNSISCTTVVNGGKLVINGSHQSGAVTVASGATLAGSGSLTAATTITGTLAPGDSIGTMNFGSTVSFGSASKLQWETVSNSLVADQAVAAGVLSVTNGAKIDLVLNRPGSTANFLLSFWRNSRTWPVASGASLTGVFQLGTVSADSSGNPASTYGAFSLQHSATGVNLVWTPIAGFPIIDEPLVTFLQPLANPVVLPNPESTLRIAATAAGGGSITYAWSTVSVEEGGNGTVTFGNPSAADTTVNISDAGRYILRCTATNSAVSRSADLTIDVGPAGDGDVSQSVADIDPGIPPTAAAGLIIPLTGSVSNETSSLWSVISGPGIVSFTNDSNPATSVVFSQAGNYVLRLTAINAIGEAWCDLAVSVSAVSAEFEAWQATHWPGVTDPLIIGTNADPDGDGATNAAEFLAGTDPTSNTAVPSFVWTQTLGGAWSGVANWNLGVGPVSNPLTKLEFLTGITSGGDVISQQDLGASFTLQRLALNGSGNGTTTLTGGTLAFASGGTMDLGNGGILYDIAAPIDLTSATMVQGSPSAETRLSGGLSGSGALTKNSTGTLEIAGHHSLAGALNINAGTLRVSSGGTSSGAIGIKGGSLTISGNGAIAPDTGASLTLGGTAVGIVHHSSTGLSRFGSIIVGNGNDGSGNCVFNQSAGTIQANSITFNNGFTGSGAGDINLTGGLLAVSSTVVVSNQAAGDNIWSTLFVDTNAALSIGNGLRLTGAPSAGRNAAGRIIQNGGSVTVANGLTMARTTASNTFPRRGEYHLNGGELNLNQVTQDLGTDTFGTFNFNGGTLKPSASHTGFLQGLTRANVRNNGARIDTGAFHITVAQPLLHSDLAGDAATDGGLSKFGSGNLTLTAANTFTGPTTVHAGALRLENAAALSSTQAIVIHPTAVLDVSGLTSHALASNRPLTIKLDGSGTGTSGRIQATGLDITAANVIFAINAPLDDPVYLLATYTAKTGSAFSTVTPPTGYALNYAYNGNQIALVSTSGFSGWISGYPNLSDLNPAGDPDGDGIANLLEYVLNGDPTISDTSILPTVDASGGNFAFTFTRRAGSAISSSQVFQYGSDLANWTELPVVPGAAVTILPEAPSAGLEQITITIPGESHDRIFGRLKASTP